MTATLRIVLDQVVAPSSPDLAMASFELANALTNMAPAGCNAAGIVPSGGGELTHRLPGLADVVRAPLQRRELIAAWQLGVGPSVGGGMIHSPTLAAPLVRHDRVHSGDQTVVTVWDTDAWDAPGVLARGAVAWQKGMLRRAAKHADAIVVPSYEVANRLHDIAAVGERVRVIPGAAPADFHVPNDADARARDLALPDAYVALDGSKAQRGALERAFRAIAETGQPVVVFDVAEERHADTHVLAVAAGVAEAHVHVRSGTDEADRATILGRSRALVTAQRGSAWPWRVVEACALGVPVVALDTAVHREVLMDGGLVVGEDDLAQAIAASFEDQQQARLRVLSADRGKSYSWQSAAERVWSLHAEL